MRSWNLEIVALPSRRNLPCRQVFYRDELWRPFRQSFGPGLARLFTRNNHIQIVAIDDSRHAAALPATATSSPHHYRQGGTLLTFCRDVHVLWNFAKVCWLTALVGTHWPLPRVVKLTLNRRLHGKTGRIILWIWFDLQPSRQPRAPSPRLGCHHCRCKLSLFSQNIDVK